MTDYGNYWDYLREYDIEPEEELLTAWEEQTEAHTDEVNE